VLDDRSFLVSLWTERFAGPIPEDFLDRWLMYGLNRNELLYIFNIVKGLAKEQPLDNAKILLSMVKKCAQKRYKNYRG